jgi:hypothetical protein
MIQRAPPECAAVIAESPSERVRAKWRPALHWRLARGWLSPNLLSREPEGR